MTHNIKDAYAPHSGYGLLAFKVCSADAIRPKDYVIGRWGLWGGVSVNSIEIVIMCSMSAQV